MPTYDNDLRFGSPGATTFDRPRATSFARAGRSSTGHTAATGHDDHDLLVRLLAAAPPPPFTAGRTAPAVPPRGPVGPGLLLALVSGGVMLVLVLGKAFDDRATPKASAAPLPAASPQVTAPVRPASTPTAPATQPVRSSPTAPLPTTTAPHAPSILRPVQPEPLVPLPRPTPTDTEAHEAPPRVSAPARVPLGPLRVAQSMPPPVAFVRPIVTPLPQPCPVPVSTVVYSTVPPVWVPPPLCLRPVAPCGPLPCGCTPCPVPCQPHRCVIGRILRRR